LRKYLHHCATIIQKTFKGYNTRVKYYRTRRQMKHFQRLLRAVVKGWKTRKILKSEAIVNLMQDIKDIENLQLEVAHNDDPEAASIKEEIPYRLSRKKRQFIDNFYRTYFNGSWVQPRYGNRSQRNPPLGQQQRGYQVRDSRERDRANDYKPRRGRQNSNDQPQERRSRGFERTASIEAYQNEGGVLEERGFNAGDHRDGSPVRGRRDEVYPEEEFDNDQGYQENQNRNSRREPSAWEARDELPITGKGAYNLSEFPEPEESEQQQAKPRVKRAQKGKRGAQKQSPNAFEMKEEMPVGGKGAYVIPDDEGQPNAYNERDELPITGKGQYVLPDDMEGETPGGSGGQSKAKPKRQVGKKAKYDPRKAIEDAKKKEEEEAEKPSKNKKSEDFRNMLKNARKFQDEKGGQEEKENVSKANNKPEKKGPPRGRARGKGKKVEDEEVAEENGDTTPVNDEKDQENEKDNGGPKTFKFLKRKTKAMAPQKLDWNKVGSRLDCWVDRTQEGTEKSPERPSTSKGKQQTLTATAHTNPNALGKPGPAAAKKNPKAATTTQKFGGRLERQEENAPVRKVMKANEGRREGYGQQKRQLSPPKQQQQQQAQRQAANHHLIKLEELEKAYNTNFLNKLNHITQKFYSESGARDPEEPYESLVPILRLNSTFFFREDMEHYFDILAELDEEYQSLQIIN